MILPSAEFTRLMTDSLTRTSCSGTRSELWCQTKLASVDPFFIELPAYRQDLEKDGIAHWSYNKPLLTVQIQPGLSHVHAQVSTDAHFALHSSWFKLAAKIHTHWSPI